MNTQQRDLGTRLLCPYGEDEGEHGGRERQQQFHERSVGHCTSQRSYSHCFRS